MTWTLTNLVIQAVTGILGAHAAASASKEHSFGFVGHTVVGAVAGAASGFFLQSLAITLVTGGGAMVEPTLAETVVIQCLAGAVVGACLMLTVGLVKHSIEAHESQKSKSS